VRPRRGRLAPAAPASIAIVATHWLGDTFWALQIVPFLRRVHPEARIDLLVRPSLVWLARQWAPDDRVHGLRSLVSDRHREGLPRPWRILAEARSVREKLGRPDLWIDLTSTPAAALFTGTLRPRFALGMGSRRFTARAFDLWRASGEFDGHLAARPWWVLEPAYAEHGTWPSPDEHMRPVFPTAVGAIGTADAPAPPPCAEDRRRVLLFPGAGWPKKRWPLARFVELAFQLERDGWGVELLFAPAEEAIAGETSRMLASEAPIGPAASGTIRLRVTEGPQMHHALLRASAVVSNDSGAAHLAAALGLPTVALFGPTNPARCGPLGPRVSVLCCDCRERPVGGQHHCLDRPRASCGRDCLGSIDVTAVRRTLVGLLEAGSPS